ncbi:DUF962 domain-containing protein [Aliikangiella marina]|uniref:DUF962 domain-containing protein n=1 Tax=Aliikangiella marina TaxID=1712262 RepID=A0A545T4F4_9GAMM|nr:Mpo1-like protein [Aliikangiella marina]TQV72101.1 DUF962 domain-containing protein [Aliikangiella marina]
MKTAQEQLSTYKSVHLSKKNIATHFIGVPSIIWSLSLLLSLYSFPVSVASVSFSLTPAMVFFGLVFIYYIKLHWRLSLGLFLFIVPVVYTTTLVAANPNALWIAVGVFFVGWVIQFIGHHYEKAKPAFVDDLNQLLIGPFFLMAEVYFMCGWEKQLEAEITPMAVEKRRAFEAAKQS